jgi:hypothetical protein
MTALVGVRGGEMFAPWPETLPRPYRRWLTPSVSRPEATRIADRLVRIGLLRKEGERRWTRYVLNE